MFLRFVATLGVLMLVVHPAFADLVKLRDGTEYVGTARPRHDIENAPFALEWIEILLDEPRAGNDLIRVDVDQVSSIVLLDDFGPRTIDFERKRVDLPSEPGNANGALAAGMVLLGISAVVVGGLVKFGSETSFPFRGPSLERNKLNVWNWVTMGGGVGLVLLGFLTYDRGRDPGPSASVSPGGLTFTARF